MLVVIPPFLRVFGWTGPPNYEVMAVIAHLPAFRVCLQSVAVLRDAQRLVPDSIG